MTVTRSLQTARQLQLYRACCPVYVDGKFSSFSLEKSVSFLFFLAPRGE